MSGIGTPSRSATRSTERGKVFVTGATGFIGWHVTRQLLDDGERVVVLARGGTKRTDLDELRNERLEVVDGDLLRRSTIDPALAGCDRVIHIAGFISTHPADRKKVHDLNYTITIHLFDALKRMAAPPKKVVYLASIFALGTGTATRPATEDVVYNLGHMPIDYFRAKREAELASYRYLAEGLPLVHAYPCFCLGPGDRYVSSSRVLLAYAKGQIPVYAEGGLNIVDVRDAARGLILALERGKVGERYLLGDHNLTYLDLFAALERLTGVRVPRIKMPAALALAAGRVAERVSRHPTIDAASARMMAQHWYYDSTKAQRELGFRGRALEETLTDALDWFLERGLLSRSQIRPRTALPAPATGA